MKTVLLPVKDFANAKQRLAPVLSSEARAGLAQAMLADVLDALSNAGPDRVVVYTASERIARMVRPFGFEIVNEPEVSGHSSAVNRMLPILASSSERVLAIASDLPHLTSDEVNRILDAACDSLVLLPSRDGAGTNGVLCVTPARIDMAYGEGSFRRHVQRAADADLPLTVLDIPGIAFDIDTADDLDAFVADPRLDSETWRFLRMTRTAAR